MKICPVCRTEIMHDASKFCTECGTRLDLAKAIEMQKEQIPETPEVDRTTIRAWVEDMVNNGGTAISYLDIHRLTGMSERDTSIMLEELQAKYGWKVGKLDNLVYYWSPYYRMDLKKHMVGPFHGFSIQIRKKQAIEIVKRDLYERGHYMGKIKDIKIRNLPLWSVQVEKQGGYIHYFINGITGGVLDIKDNHLFFPFENFIPEQIVQLDYEKLPKRQMKLEKLSKSCRHPVLHREHAVFVVENKIKELMDSHTIPTLLYLPLYEVSMKYPVEEWYNIWVDAVTGSCTEYNPFEDHQY